MFVLNQEPSTPQNLLNGIIQKGVNERGVPLTVDVILKITCFRG